MGRMLGSYDSDELDRPDLNKCPDCGCFFAQDECPLCGKPCPEEMRAGNRKAVKVKKTKAGSERVSFINSLMMLMNLRLENKSIILSDYLVCVICWELKKAV